MNNKKSLLEGLYLYSAILTLMLSFFSNDETLGLGKVFFIPAAFCLVLSVLMRHRFDKTDLIMISIIVLTAISTALFYDGGPFLELPVTRMVVGYFCCRDIRFMKINDFLIPVLSLTPIVLYLHFHYSDLSAYRYGGFYGDPNYLAVMFQVIIVLICLSTLRFKSIALKIYVIVLIFFILQLILFGLSRAGMVTALLLLASFLFNAMKRNQWVIIAFVAIGIYFTVGIIGKNDADTDKIKALSARFEGMREGNIRSRIDANAFEKWSSQPEYYLFGMGPGQSSQLSVTSEFSGTHYTVHNTYLALMIEQGVIAFLLFLFFYFRIFKECWQSDEQRVFKLGYLLTLLINTYSIRVLSFIGFWWAISLIRASWNVSKENP